MFQILSIVLVIILEERYGQGMWHACYTAGVNTTCWWGSPGERGHLIDFRVDGSNSKIGL